VQLFRFATSVYGDSDVIVGASWDLLPWFVAAGAVFIVVHAIAHALIVAAGRPRGGSR
jgi:hypothetical protein